MYLKQNQTNVRNCNLTDIIQRTYLTKYSSSSAMDSLLNLDPRAPSTIFGSLTSGVYPTQASLPTQINLSHKSFSITTSNKVLEIS